MTGRSPSTSPSKKHSNSDKINFFVRGSNDASPSRGVKRQRTASLDDITPSEIASRVIIALDLDAFYVSACRKRDPSLIGIPIGIQQKALVATISYEARAAGVGKLDSIKDALKKCPDMVLVNGEDLTYFRQVSSQVWRLVRSIVWQKRVEKLGMDELFCDVTEMVDHHLSTVSKAKDGTRWFDLNAPDQNEKVEGYGFDFPTSPAEPAGHTHPSDAAEHLAHNRPDGWQERMLIAARLAYYIRQRISDEVGLTCSAGIAPSKSLAKLVGALNKPNQQTAFCPPVASLASSPYNGARSVEANLLQHIHAFQDPLDLRKLPGFGRVVVDKIRDHLTPHPNAPSKQGNGRARINFMDPTSVSDDEEEKVKVKVTAGTARKMLSLEQLGELFGEVIGPRLWALVSGRDVEPVIPAPDFPLQLSIEDTYPYPSLRGAAIHAEIRRLSLSLLRRLELELTTQAAEPAKQPQPLSQETVIKNEAVTIRDYQDEQPPPSAMGRATWLRYPMKVRLSVRQGWSNRVSKQTKMPVEIFELEHPRDIRAGAIEKACRGLLRALIGGDDVVGDGMNLINIAALDLSDKRPQRALGSFFAPSTAVEVKTRQGEPTQAAKIDEGFLASLAPELREEIAREYGIDVATTSLRIDTVKDQKASDVASFDAAEKPSIKGKGKAALEPGPICPTCGEEMQVWMQHDHESYPFSGVPVDALRSSTPDSFDEEITNEQDEGDIDLIPCELCGEQLKPFMLVAHHRFHELQS
ncbi:DNA-repair protein, UmuC-like protein [Kalmanozyma brasiliensis GHG001]|uniref:DNA-repair protein, UmuC-like protein n=1 Tax=Kalmanozyma brasiliensis (strain GHG001) TaxID=1365824 RepID=UPI00286839A9|nr:DNA-repair protein, UmuC-like protein [Kalmanozyma brasiliensis GHG001]EST06125.2 DNA-repair protein, UmuC-like protein [Kalmanozyma brasiliensis GHG001]